MSDVINLFTEQLKISNKESLSLYYGIQKLGRSLLIKGSENECSELAASLHQLQTKVLPLIIAQHQECSLFLLKLLLDISTETTGLQKICAMVSLFLFVVRLISLIKMKVKSKYTLIQ